MVRQWFLKTILQVPIWTPLKLVWGWFCPFFNLLLEEGGSVLRYICLLVPYDPLYNDCVNMRIPPFTNKKELHFNFNYKDPTSTSDYNLLFFFIKHHFVKKMSYYWWPKITLWFMSYSFFSICTLKYRNITGALTCRPSFARPCCTRRSMPGW